jgi:hypothetical protein
MRLEADADAGRLPSLSAVPLNEQVQIEQWLELPVTEWSPFSLWLNCHPMRLEDQTVTQSPGEPRPFRGPATLAHVLYELLGGARQMGVPQHFPPLPAVNEAGNAMLRRAINGHGTSEDCVTFWERWLRACDMQPPAAWRIPRWLLNVASPGDVLRLLTDASLPAVELIARRRFRLGRSRSRSDFPTRVHRSDGSLDEAVTAQFSRVQALGEWTGSALTWRDGDGEKASTNGTHWEDTALSSIQGTAFSTAGVLTLARSYRIQVVPLPSTGLTGPASILNLSNWSGFKQSVPVDALPFGAVLLRPLDGQPITRDAIWLGMEIGFEPGVSGSFDWGLPSRTRRAACFLHLHGCFWIANSGLESNTLRLNDAALDPGQIAPLSEGQDLEIAGRRYKVTVS